MLIGPRSQPHPGGTHGDLIQLLSHFGLVLYVGNVSVPLRLQDLPLVLRALLGLLLRHLKPLLAQLAAQRPGEGEAAASAKELFGAAAGRVGLVDVVEAVVVHLVEAVLQRQDWHEAVAPLDLTADVGTPRLARHACSHKDRVLKIQCFTVICTEAI